MTRAELVEALLAATPAPPVDAEPESLLAAFDQIYAERERVLAPTLGSPPTGTVAQSLVDQLRQREQAWMTALSLARELLASAQGSAGKLAAYTAGQTEL